MNRRFVNTAAALLALLVSSGAGAAENESSPAWTELKRCVLLENPANDADSFHVRHGKKEYFLRLYFVDAPETNMRYPDRVREQAEWFGTTDAMIIHFGEASAVYVRQLLGKPFTVYTQFIDARGASSEQRLFAMVKIGDRYLCELLVEQGFARIYGIRRDLPDGTAHRRHERRLAELEKQAQWKKTGIWSGLKSALVSGAAPSSGKSAEPARTVTLSRDTAFFTATAMPTFRGNLRKGETVQVLSVHGEMAVVQAPFRGNLETGRCHRKDLGL
jgi:endonuclease YncB( thermonuclease family)